MFIILAALFILIPVIELRILWSLSGSIGILQTMLIVVFTGIVGAQLARSQGIKVVNSINEELKSGKMPADSLLSAALVLVGGVLLLTPGILTDIFGLCLLIPPFRAGIAVLLKKFFKSHFNVINVNNFNQNANTFNGSPYNEEDIVEVDAHEVVDEDEDSGNNV